MCLLVGVTFKDNKLARFIAFPRFSDPLYLPTPFYSYTFGGSDRLEIEILEHSLDIRIVEAKYISFRDPLVGMRGVSFPGN